MRKIWHQISFMGIEGENLPDYLRSRILLTNRMGVLGAFFTVPMFFLWNKFFPPSFVVLIFAFILISLPYLNLKRHYNFSRLLITITPSLTVLLVTSFFDYTTGTFPTGGRILAFALALAPLFFWSFKELKFLILGFIIDVLCYFGWYLLNPAINVPGLAFKLSPVMFSIVVGLIAFLVIIFQFFFIEQYYLYSEKKLEEALQKAKQKTLELENSERTLKEQNENLRRTSEELQSIKEELEYKNQDLERIKAELEENANAIRLQQNKAEKIKEYDDLLREYLEKDAREITQIFLSKLAKEFKIGKIILTLFSSEGENKVFAGFGIPKELYNQNIINSLLSDMTKNGFGSIMDLEEENYQHLLFIETGTAKFPAKYLMMLPLKYQDIILGGTEMLFYSKPDKNEKSLIRDIINNFTTVLFYKLERENFIQT